MSSFIYSTGLRNVGSYQVAGIPYLTASDLSAQEKLFEFPYVTQNIIVENTGAGDLHLYFSASSVAGNHLILPAATTLNIDVKCVFIYASASVSTGMQMAAELTNIGTTHMYSLDGLEGV